MKKMKTFNILLNRSILLILFPLIFSGCKDDTNPPSEIPVFGKSSVSSIGNFKASIYVDFGYKLYPYSFKFGVIYDVSPNFTDLSSVSCYNQGTTNLVNLKAATTYYYKAYATNGIDYVYGDVGSFTTQTVPVNGTTGTFTDSRDGHIYKTVQIGTQTWMAENLAYLPVSASPATVGAEQTGKAGLPFYYVYDLAKYGVLYNWYAALTVAPAGWHLPTVDDWTTLSNSLGGDLVSGDKMKSTFGWVSPNTVASNSSGFTALPGGYRYFSGLGNDGSFGFWWCDLGVSGKIFAWHRALYSNHSDIIWDYLDKSVGFSVRCVKD